MGMRGATQVTRNGGHRNSPNAPDEPANQEDEMIITAKFPGTCRKCNQPITVGEKIEWEKSAGATHVKCPAQPEYEIHDTSSPYDKQWRPATAAELEPLIETAAAYQKKTVAEIRELIAAGTAVAYQKGPNYYYTHGEYKIRKYRKPAPKPEMVKCDCGHSVPRGLVMSASLGSSCPNCYDRMSA
jgi:hypothetical protein